MKICRRNYLRAYSVRLSYREYHVSSSSGSLPSGSSGFCLSHHVNVGVPQGSVLATILILLFTVDFELTSNHIHCFAHNTALYYSTDRQAVAKIDCDRTVLSASLASNLQRISAWGSTNLVCFSPQTTSLFCFAQMSPSFCPFKF